MSGSSLKIIVVFFFIGHILIGKASAQPWKAKWTGDAVLESEEAFYALTPSSHALGKNGFMN